MTSQSLLVAERYALDSAIARGGMATVWRARDEVLARTVAVKILHPHLSDDAAFLERFRREALAAARLTHPNVVSIYDTGFDHDDHDGERHYIVMEYCGGGTLAELAASTGGRLPPDRMTDIAVVICDALEYAHASGIVHRDIKPANVLRSEAGAIKVGDFGIAKAAAQVGDITTTGTILGTVTYLSPEQARGEEPDARSDIYSLGIVLYELLVGRPPFQNESQVATALMHVNEAPQPPRAIVPTLPRNLESVILTAIAKDPGERYPSAGAMRDALGSTSGGWGTSVMRAAAPVAAGGPVPLVRSEMRWLWPVLVLIAAAIAAVIILPIVLGDDDPSGTASPGGGPQRVPALDVARASSFDPDGDDDEHGNEVAHTFDDDPATAWSTESYSTAFSDQKTGVGILFDLGVAKEVAGIQLHTTTPGFSLEIRAADSPPASIEGSELVAQAGSIEDNATIELDEPEESQYWLIWITRLPGADTGSASISEVEFISG